MNEYNSIEIDKRNLADETKFRLNEMTKNENYFNAEINQRKSCSKKLSKYVSTFDYIDKVLTVLSATSVGIPIISFTSIAGAPFGIASAIQIYSNFFSNNRNNQKTIEYNKKQKKSMIKFLC